MSVMDFVVSPPGCGWSVTDFWGGTPMRPGYVVSMRWMVIYGYGMPGGALNLNYTNYPDHGQHEDPPLSGKNPHGRSSNRTRDHMTTRPRGWSHIFFSNNCRRHVTKNCNLMTFWISLLQVKLPHHSQNFKLLYTFWQIWSFHRLTLKGLQTNVFKAIKLFSRSNPVYTRPTNTNILNFIFCWPCIIMYHNNVTSLIHFHFHKHFIVF
jgi:hypothetical protein